MTSASRLNDILKTTTCIQWGCHYARTGSTNADALSLIRSTPAYLNVPGMVVADHQTSGKGRQNKSWDAPPGADILMSAVVWPTVPVCDWPTVPFALGLAVRAALRPHVPSSYSVQLKWPNDILINHQKCVGLLAEADAKRQAVVLGVGINVNQLPTDTTRTSLRVVNQMLMDRWGILSDVIHSLDTHWPAIESGQFDVLQWETYAAYMHQRVTLKYNGKLWDGVFEGIHQNGALKLRVGDHLHCIHGGSDLRLMFPVPNM